jgi:hypothetical protein
MLFAVSSVKETTTFFLYISDTVMKSEHGKQCLTFSELQGSSQSYWIVVNTPRKRWWRYRRQFQEYQYALISSFLTHSLSFSLSLSLYCSLSFCYYSHSLVFICAHPQHKTQHNTIHNTIHIHSCSCFLFVWFRFWMDSTSSRGSCWTFWCRQILSPTVCSLTLLSFS